MKQVITVFILFLGLSCFGEIVYSDIEKVDKATFDVAPLGDIDVFIANTTNTSFSSTICYKTTSSKKELSTIPIIEHPLKIHIDDHLSNLKFDYCKHMRSQEVNIYIYPRCRTGFNI